MRIGCGLKRKFGPSFGRIVAVVGSIPSTLWGIAIFTTILKKRYANVQ